MDQAKGESKVTQPEWKFPMAIDSTMRAAFTSCEQKFSYEFVECLGPQRPSIHLHAGATFAKGLETFRRFFYLHKQPLDYCVEQARIQMLIEWGDFEPMFSWSDGAGPKSLDSLFDALDYYLMTWPPGEDPVTPWIHDGQIAVEFSFALPIPGTRHPETGDPVLYAGRFDQLCVYNDTMFVEDDKTASQLGASWMNQWALRGQLIGYNWAAREYDYPVAGSIVRGISFLKTGFGSAQAIELCEQWKIDRWLVQLQRDVQRMIKLYESRQPNMAFADACTSYGGCPFVKLCNSVDPNTWKSEYGRREWNPLAKV